MDRNVEIGLVAALIAAILGYALRGSLRDGRFELNPAAIITRSELPEAYWIGIGILVICIAVMAFISMVGFLGWI
jgi:hypothetical protein